MLNGMLPYLDQPLIRDLAAGNPSLAARRLNIYLDLAEAYALQGNRRESLDYLRKVLAASPNPEIAKFIERQESFGAMREDPEFKQILLQFRRYEALWDSKALSTPFRENISDAEKLAGLGKFWSEVKYNFAYPEKLIALDWDKLYLEAIPRILATKSTAGYYRELMRLCASLGDGHTNVNEPAAANISAKPPLRTGLVEGRVMILEVMSPALEAQGVRAGAEIAAVDGEPAIAYARREVEPYQSAATPQDREIRTFWYGFLRGPREKSVRLTLRDPAGNESEKQVMRQGFTDVRRRPLFEWRMLPGNIAYVALNGFDNDTVVKQWREAFPKIKEASALILDLRLNGGGSSNFGFEILTDLAKQPFLASRERMRKYNPTDRARGTLMEFTEAPAGLVTPRPGGFHSKPAVVLSSGATYSAAEDFLVAWKNSGRGKIIGEPTGGSTGQPLIFSLPGGGGARVCTKQDTFPDGREWVGKGIEPDILVRPTLAGLWAGRDTVLERALEFLRTSAVK